MSRHACTVFLGRRVCEERRKTLFSFHVPFRKEEKGVKIKIFLSLGLGSKIPILFSYSVFLPRPLGQQ